jgi:putative heme-binding domain-containing protein
MATGSVMNNSVYWFRINEDGSGFRVKDLPPLLVSSDTRFRPVDVKVGPDGAIYVADWYNPIIGHYQASLRHPDRDKTHGRIWRITAKGRSLVKPPDLASMALPELLDQLRSEERWTRYQVKRLLTEKDPKEVATALAAWVGHLDPADPRHEHLLFEALGAYETLEIVEPKLLGRVLAAKDYRARAFATSVIGHWQDRLADPIALLEPQARDESPRVRLEAVVAASYVPSPRAIDVVLAAAERPTDRFIDYAVTQAVHALKPQWKPALDAGQVSFAGHPERLRTLCKADGTADTVHLLVAMLKSDKAEGAFRDAILGLLADVGGPEDLTLVLGDPRMKAGNEQAVVRVLRAMATSARQRKVKPAGDTIAALRTFLNSGDSSVGQAAVTLVGLWHVEGLRGEIEGVARDSKAATDVRRVAMEALADIGGKPAAGVLRELANGREPAEVRAAAVTAWARRDPKGAAAAAVRLMGGDEGAARVSDLVTTFLSRQGGAEALAAAVRETRIPVDAAKLALRTMSAAGRQDEPLRDALNAVVGGAVVHREYDADLVKRLAADALAHGDPAAGERVFRGAMTNCFACHSIGGAGGRVGPDLATVGTANPVELVIESVLWPNKQVKEGYTATLVETRGGDVYQGYLINQDPSGVALRESTTERVIRVAASDVKRKRNIGSLMPDGLVDALTQAEVRDLIRFLSELGKPGPYRVPEAPMVRTWQVLTSVPGGAAKLPPQEAVQVVWHAPASAWQPRYSTAGGELPAEDIAAAGSGGMRWVRFDVEVLRPGRFRLGPNSAAGLVLWLDGRGIKLGDAGGAEVEMGAGAREFMAGVDPARRGAVGLSFRIEPAAGSAGEVRLTTATTDMRGQ